MNKRYVTYRFLDNDPVISVRRPLARCIGQMYVEVANILGLTGPLQTKFQLTVFNGQLLTTERFCFLSHGEVVEVTLKGQYSKHVLFSPTMYHDTLRKAKKSNWMMVDQCDEQKSSVPRCKRKLEQLFLAEKPNRVFMTDDDDSDSTEHFEHEKSAQYEWEHARDKESPLEYSTCKCSRL